MYIELREALARLSSDNLHPEEPIRTKRGSIIINLGDGWSYSPVVLSYRDVTHLVAIDWYYLR